MRARTTIQCSSNVYSEPVIPYVTLYDHWGSSSTLHIPDDYP